MKRERFASDVEFNTDIVDLAFNTNLSEKQKKANILAKVIIKHPAFTCTGTIYTNKEGKRWVNTASIKTGKTEDAKWFDIVRLTYSFKQYILNEFDKLDTEEQEPWYMKKLNVEAVTQDVVDAIENESLDIIKLSFSYILSDQQKKANIKAKVNVETSIGTVVGYTVYLSQYGKALYGRPQELDSGDDEDKKVTAFELTPLCEAQVLSYIHNSMEEEDWVFIAREEGAVTNTKKAEEPESLAKQREEIKKKIAKSKAKKADKEVVESVEEAYS